MMDVLCSIEALVATIVVLAVLVLVVTFPGKKLSDKEG